MISMFFFAGKWLAIIIVAIVAAIALLVGSEWLWCFWWSWTRCELCHRRFGFRERDPAELARKHQVWRDEELDYGYRCPHCKELSHLRDQPFFTTR
jgi:hypothetical protein